MINYTILQSIWINSMLFVRNRVGFKMNIQFGFQFVCVFVVLARRQYQTFERCNDTITKQKSSFRAKFQQYVEFTYHFVLECIKTPSYMGLWVYRLIHCIWIFINMVCVDDDMVYIITFCYLNMHSIKKYNTYFIIIPSGNLAGSSCPAYQSSIEA